MSKTTGYQPMPLLGPMDELENFVAPLTIAKIEPTIHKTALEDLTMTRQFLQSYRGSAATFTAYRRETERLLQWLFFIKSMTLQAIDRQHIEAFIEFCQQPPKHWIGTTSQPRQLLQGGIEVPNPQWRPFLIRAPKNAPTPANQAQFSLSQSAQESILRILSSYFTFLEQEEYILHNPVKRIRQKNRFVRRIQSTQMIRRLSELQWDYVISTARDLATHQDHERTLFIMSALYGMYLRISELVASDRWTPQMNHFFLDQEGHWWFKTVGKGNKERDISVSAAMLTALQRYRLSMGLSALPTPADHSPLLPKTKGFGGIKSTRHIRRIVQYCFDHAVEQLTKDGFDQDANQLKVATVHWLRHTGISDDVKIRPREHVRDDAGHTNSAITDKYIDIDRRERHASALKKTIDPGTLTNSADSVYNGSVTNSQTD